jgi:hypothetical protein
MASIRCNLLLLNLFFTTIIYCPSHVGIKGNDLVDCIANSLPEPPNPRHRSSVKTTSPMHASEPIDGDVSAPSPEYKDRQRLAIRRKNVTLT